jgi:hypothetical protein
VTSAAVPARSRSARARSGADGSARAGRLPGLLPARLLRLELHRSTMLWIVPLVAVLSAQQAVAVALAKTSGVPQLGPADGHQRARGTPAPQVRAAALRFAALPAAARHAWLAAHLAALRVGHVTLRTLP